MFVKTSPGTKNPTKRNGRRYLNLKYFFIIKFFDYEKSVA